MKGSHTRSLYTPGTLVDCCACDVTRRRWGPGRCARRRLEFGAGSARRGLELGAWRLEFGTGRVRLDRRIDGRTGRWRTVSIIRGGCSSYILAQGFPRSFASDNFIRFNEESGVEK